MKTIVPGQKFSFWEVREFLPPRGCKCICTGCMGTEKYIDKWDLIREKTKSCGCQTNILRQQKIKEKYGVDNYSQTEVYKEQYAQTCLEKYGVSHPSLLLSNRQKAQETTVIRYGVENYNQLPEAQERRKQICLKKYGVENISQSAQIKQKKEAISLYKFGTKIPSQSPEIREEIKQTCLNKYGVESTGLVCEFQEKRKQTNLEKYGVKNYTQTIEHHQKTIETNLKKYGVRHKKQLPENRNKLRDWCDTNPDRLQGISNSECELKIWIQVYFIASKIRKCGNELDIFIPELNLGIEHNGLYWHSEVKKPANYHLDKTNFFIEKGIRTIHIWEHEWKYKQEQVKSFLLSALGKNQHKIGARKCDIVWSNSKEEIGLAHQLLDSTHIQGHTNSTKHVANVYYQNDLVATATFGKHHRDSKTWVLSRFTTKTNYTIQGILSKISKLASRRLQSDIISWADYRLSQGNGYERAGWKFEELLKPDYFYHKGLKVFSKQSRQKKLVNTPKEVTEHQHAKLDGLFRVYDCGKIRYKYIYANSL